ncbi:MAG: LCP family protein [bacterium]|jgi:LCP family protein required for cell wall assembly
MTVTVRQRRVRKRINWKRFGIFLTGSLLFIVLMVGSSIYTILLGITGNNRSPGTAQGEEILPPKIGERVNVLLLGVDAGVIEGTHKLGPTRTDTMMVVSFDPETLEGGVISIPRDTRVDIPGKGTNKINAAHAFGGPLLAKKTVEGLLDIPIHYYVKVNLEGFEQIVDALGGIELVVEEDMKYWDPVQDLRIDLKASPEPQLLNGHDALGYVRYRGDGGGDIGRIPRQQKFLRVLADKLLSMSAVWKIPELVSIFTKNVETDMDVLQIVQYAEKARKMNLEDLEIETLAGIDQYVNDISYWLVDEEVMREQVGRVLKGINREENRDIKVQILNGNGKSGDASKLAAEMRRYGFNVVAVANADHFEYEESLIINHGEDILPARKVARATGIYRINQGDSVVVDQDNEVDITVIIGKNP